MSSAHKQSHLFGDRWYPVACRVVSPSKFPSLIRPAGANSIHGFITVQITTIYLWTRTNVEGPTGTGRNERSKKRRNRRGGVRDGQPPCIQKYFTLTALRGIGWPCSKTLHRFSIMDLYITYSSWPMSCQKWPLLVSTSFHFRVRLIANWIHVLPVLAILRGQWVKGW